MVLLPLLGSGIWPDRIHILCVYVAHATCGTDTCVAVYNDSANDNDNEEFEQEKSSAGVLVYVYVCVCMFVRREVEERDVKRGVNSSPPVGFPSEIEKADHIDSDDDDNIINDDPFVGRQEPFPLFPTQASPPCPSSFPLSSFL